MTDIAPFPSGTAEDHLATLRRVANETGATKPAEIVWRALQEAVEIVDRLPDRERSWLRSGRRTNWLGPTNSSASDARKLERHRTLAGMVSGDAMEPVRSARNAESALLTLEWLRWLQGHRHADRLEAAALMILRGDDRQAAATIFKPNRAATRSRQTTYEIRQIATGLILAGLRDQFGIAADDIAAAEPIAA